MSFIVRNRYGYYIVKNKPYEKLSISKDINNSRIYTTKTHALLSIRAIKSKDEIDNVIKY
jgi:hypothetical protein